MRFLAHGLQPRLVPARADVEDRRRGPVDTPRATDADAAVRVPTPSRAAAEEEKDADASIEPCLVGWSETDENGVEAYCCEQPGGGMECRTVSDDHAACELVTNEDGELVVNCSVDDEEEDKAAKAREDDKAAKAAALRHL